jgi:hypothetical protein
MKSGDPNRAANDLTLVIQRLGGGSSFHVFEAMAVLTLNEGWRADSVVLHRETSSGTWDDGVPMVQGMNDECVHGVSNWRLEFTSTGSGTFRFKAEAQATRVTPVQGFAEWP